ncbi:MAG: TIGR02266 family protein [Myxococcales bacterium]|nr:TIGR02266 family protein [Myxococcales bacterium]
MLAHDAPTPRPGPEGRRAERHQAVIEVSVTSGHNFWTGLTQNISSGGLFLACENVQPIGTQLEFAFVLEPDPFIHQLRGIVRWVRPVEMASDGLPAGMGIQFRDLTDELKTAIEAFIEQERESLYHDEDSGTLL